ncbi:uncharacterized protein LOC115316376 isoform X4 [Ixodes scapularis]|uniref:uncharacterized protein LOC115316376 isoform X4 n=1 Tax=Ixodes scapularis TaxID=6945 RepID=UPI001A9DCAB2|nr:uncharacterized protein LOC115316376 isoform X4 [Ixodes scapularis]
MWAVRCVVAFGQSKIAMIVKIWSLDKTIKKLAVVATFDAIKKKAIEFGICCNGDIKVHMLDGTEVDEEAFNCLNQSSEDATYTFIATTDSWVSGQQGDVTSTQHEGVDVPFGSQVQFPWSSLSKDVMKALQEGTQLNPTDRQEVVRMAAAACQKVKARPSAREIRSAASYLVDKYPGALGDPTSCSATSVSSVGLAYKIENRIENNRRGCKRLVEVLSGGTIKLKKQTSRSAYGCVNWQPATTSSSLHEVEASRKFLLDEALKSTCEQDVCLQTKAMAECYPHIRTFINSSEPPYSALDVKRAWPLLFVREHLLDHFHRLTGVCLDGKLSLPKDVLLLVTFLRSSPKNDAVLEWSLKINKAEAEFKDQNAAAVCLLPLLASYFQENLGELFQLHQVTTEITEEFRNSLPASPVIVALGRSLFECSCQLFVDHEVMVEDVGFLQAVELLFALYYCLNIQYAKGAGTTLEFIQRYQVGIKQHDGSRQEAGRSKGARARAIKAATDLAAFEKKWNSLI